MSCRLPSWGFAVDVELAERERARVLAVLPGAEWEHVGAASVVELVLVVDDSADEASYVPALEAAGYRVSVREAWHEHRVLTRPGVEAHVYPRGCAVVCRRWCRRATTCCCGSRAGSSTGCSRARCRT
ncbi:GrpB family protein [Lentzea californiensis]|uniref:GrpB family protein n=1 Tax=Lentzea californiensis TaxID=438851 RepID=UPI0027DA6DFE|nr:GrpB family protein [Lentzea californiensis]